MSRGKLPVTCGYGPRERKPARACPNSWKRVLTSEVDSSFGLPSAAREKLQLMVTSGSTSRSPAHEYPRRREHHAPPRLPLRTKQSR